MPRGYALSGGLLAESSLAALPPILRENPACVPRSARTGRRIIVTPSEMTRYFFGTDGNMFVERRASPRYDVELDVEVRVVGSPTPIRGKTQDISEAGMQLLLPKSIRDGRVVDFTSPAFGGSAQAVWCHGEGSEVRVGVRFVSLSPTDREALLQVIARLKKAAAASAVGGWE